MKQHLATIARCNMIIRGAEARTMKVAGERERYTAALEAAEHLAKEARTKVAHLSALAAIGQADNAALSAATAEAEKQEALANSLRSALAGFEGIETAATTDAAEARQARADAVLAALQVHIESVAAQYLAAAQDFIRANRRIHALSRIRNSLTGQYGQTLFASNSDASEVQIPALNLPMFDELRTGFGRGSIYNAASEIHAAHTEHSVLLQAVEEETAALEKMGLEI